MMCRPRLYPGKKCRYPGCNADARVRLLCPQHYSQVRYWVLTGRTTWEAQGDADEIQIPPPREKWYEKPHPSLLTRDKVLGFWKDPKLADKMRKASAQNLRKRWKDPAFADKIRKAGRNRWKDPKHREKMRKVGRRVAKQQWSCPEHRELVKLSSQKHGTDPELRANHSLLRKEWKVVSPTGRIYRINHLVRFCKEMEGKTYDRYPNSKMPFWRRMIAGLGRSYRYGHGWNGWSMPAVREYTKEEYIEKFVKAK